MIATPKLMPKLMSWYELKNVAIPSGKLWSINAIIFKIPSLYKLFVLFLILLILFIRNFMEKTPINNDNAAIPNPLCKLLISNTFNEFGIKSVMLIPIIITNEKLKHIVINLLIFSFLILKKIINAPIIVENPAMVETSKGPIISMISPLQFMN